MASDDPSARPPWMPSPEEDDGRLLWNQDEGDLLIGQYVLLGLTYLAADGETVTSQVQCHGKITKADQNGIAILCEGTTWQGQTATLPPDLRALRPAEMGEYRLRSTGEIVKNPDLLMTWTITAPPKPS